MWVLYMEGSLLKEKKNGCQKPNSAVACVFSDTQGGRVKVRDSTNITFDRTKDLNSHFRFTRAVPYRALTLSQADSTFNLAAKARAFKASMLT